MAIDYNSELCSIAGGLQAKIDIKSKETRDSLADLRDKKVRRALIRDYISYCQIIMEAYEVVKDNFDYQDKIPSLHFRNIL